MLLNRTSRIVPSIATLVLGVRCGGCDVRGAGMPCATCHATIRRGASAPMAGFHDAGPLARLVRLAKRGAWRGGERYLARMLVERWAERPETAPGEVDLVTWVPADRRRRAERGGHLPERLARALARELDVPSIGLLRRRDGRHAQRGLGRVQRLLNVADAFTVLARPAALARARGARVLLIDDVRTTGATLNAASRTLLPHARAVVPMAVVGVDRCLESRTEHRFRAQDSNHPCRCPETRSSKGQSRLVAPRPP